MKKGNPVIAICAASAVFMAALGVSPGIANFIEYYGIDPTTAQLPLIIPSIVAIPCTLITGKIVEYVSKKIMSLIGIAIVTLSGVLPYFFADFGVVIGMRVVMGAGVGILLSIAPSLAAEFYPEGGKRDFAMGLQSAFSGAGGFIFNILAGYLVVSETRRIHLVYLLCIIFFVITAVTLPNTPPRKKQAPSVESDKSGTFDRRCNPFAVVVFLLMCSVLCINMNVSVFLETETLGSSVEAGFTSSAFSIAAFVCGFVYARIVRLLKSQTRMVACLISAVGLLVFGMATGLSAIYIGAALAGVGMSILLASSIGMVSQIVTPSTISMSISILMVGNLLAQTLSPYVTAAAAIPFGGTIRANFYAAAVILLVTAVYTFFSNRRVAKAIADRPIQVSNSVTID